MMRRNKVAGADWQVAMQMGVEAFKATSSSCGIAQAKACLYMFRL